MKILTVLSLFVPTSQLPEIMLVFSVCLIAGTGSVLFCRRIYATADSDWAFLGTRRMPMGLPIGMAGLTSLLMICLPI